MARELIVLDSAQAVALEGARIFQDSALKASQRNGKFTVALSGGSTPKGMFQILAADPFKNGIPWDKCFIFWSDERSVGAEHPDSNYRMANENLLSKVPLPAGNIFRMAGESPDLKLAAKSYSEQIGRISPDFSLDLIYLGMGSDGHTASLFPHTKALRENESWVIENHVPKLNTNRLTFTYKMIQAAKKVVFLTCGKDKAPAFKEVWQGKPNLEEYPSQGITCPDTNCVWIVDREAASLIQ
jgi:6-phosphogluconolactonase